MDGSTRRSVTLAQVAAEAGVSLATASRVLSGAVRVVRPELRERVLAAARQLNFVPNAHAQALAVGATTTVGLIMHDVTDPYFAAITRGAMQVATDKGLLVVLGSTFRSPELEIQYVSTLRAQRARAILLVGSGFTHAEYLHEMRDQLAGYADGGGRYAFVSQHNLPGESVLPENRGGGAMVGRALLDLGHRRLAVATGPSRLTAMQHRVSGFLDALASGGIPRSEVQLIECDLSESGGYRAAALLVAEGLPAATALFCVADVIAIGALLALREQRVRVPEQLSLIGFDDIPIMRHLTPSMSTVELDLERMGREAMLLVLTTAEQPRTVPIPARLVLRESTGPPR